MADHPSEEGTSPEGIALDSDESTETGSGALIDDATILRRLRPPPNFRGHIVVEDDEPLPVFAVPADPPPTPPVADGSAGRS